MANLSPLFTGRPFVVWISPRNASHDIRVKISRSGKAIPENLISIALRPTLRVIGDEQLTQEELRRLDQWVKLNHAVCVGTRPSS